MDEGTTVGEMPLLDGGKAATIAAPHEAAATPTSARIDSGQGGGPEPEALSVLPAAAAADPIVMHVVVRTDLATEQGWPLGSLITQACHASVAAVEAYREDEYTQLYLKDLKGMRKVSVEVKDEAALLKLKAGLEKAGVEHHLWVEQPEGIPTALATKPRLKSTVPKVLKKLKLFSLKL
jgi:peptidyl-tRNA hydrolase